MCYLELCVQEMKSILQTERQFTLPTMTGFCTSWCESPVPFTSDSIYNKKYHPPRP